MAGYDTSNEKFTKFRNEFFAKYNKEPYLGIFQAADYDAMMILHEAIQNKNNTEAVKNYLNNNKFEGVSGKIIFNEDGLNYGVTKEDVLIIE